MQRMQNEVQILLKKFWVREYKNSGGNRWKSDHRFIIVLLQFLTKS